MTNHGGWLCHAPPTFRIRPCFGTVARFSVFFRCDCCQKCGASSSTRAKTKVEERKKRYLSLRRFGMAKVKDDAAGRMLTSRSDTRRCAPRRTVLASLDPHALNHVTDEIGSRSAQTPERRHGSIDQRSELNDQSGAAHSRGAPSEARRDTGIAPTLPM